MTDAKPIVIPKSLVFTAYQRIKANKGSAGVDGESLNDFELNLRDNLYKVWNRLSSGSYLPPAVRRVEIPKGKGKTRPLGIPTVSDRIAQMVVKLQIEPLIEPHFHPDSYGYRPNKSAHQAVKQARTRCWKRAWVLDMDIQGFFDNIDHELMMRAVKCHISERGLLLYIERWLKAPVQLKDGSVQVSDKGTPQGGVISPLLANLFLHYVFDRWLETHWTGIQFERYADDIVCHCVSKRQAEALYASLQKRFETCGLKLHPEKTKIVYCKDANHKGSYPVITFDFLGFTFKPRLTKSRYKGFFVSYGPAISRSSSQRIWLKMREWRLHRRHDKTIEELSSYCRASVRGWINYYGQIERSVLKSVLFHLDKLLSKWAYCKYRKIRSRGAASRWLSGVQERQPGMFAHWLARKRIGLTIRAV